ncbi:MAG: hypothetical protein P4L60_25975 [Clostridium sp.]|nr:hypothetical protein [Clostridium sp.]
MLSKTCIFRLLVILIFISALMIMRKIEPDFLAHSNGAKVLDMRFGYDVADVLRLFMTLDVLGRSIYVRYLCIDFVFIASFAIVQNYILKFIMGQVMLSSKWRVLLAIAYLRAFFDVTENIIILILLTSFPTMLSSLVTVASCVTRIKYILLGIWLLVIPTSFVVGVMIRKKKKVEVL